MKKTKGVVYCVTGPNGKRYVGITTKTAKARWAGHINDALRGSTRALQRAIRKYGADAFSVKVLKKSDDWKQLCQLEVEYIAKLRTRTHQSGYNLTRGSEGVVDPTPEECARRSDRIKRLHADPEFKSKQAAAASKGLKRLHADPEFKSKQAAAMKRLHADPEFRAKRNAAMKLLWTDEAFRAKQAAAQRTAFNDFCREHNLSAKSVRQRLRKLGIYGLKDINDPRVRAVLDQMLAERALTKKPRTVTSTGQSVTLH